MTEAKVRPETVKQGKEGLGPLPEPRLVPLLPSLQAALFKRSCIKSHHLAQCCKLPLYHLLFLTAALFKAPQLKGGMFMKHSS